MLIHNAILIHLYTLNKDHFIIPLIKTLHNIYRSRVLNFKHHIYSFLKNKIIPSILKRSKLCMVTNSTHNFGYMSREYMAMEWRK